MSNPFPGSILSLQTIGNALGLPSPYKMSDLSGKRIYLADGTRLFITYPINLNFNFFRGKYSSPPSKGPVINHYTNTIVITSANYPTVNNRTPTYIDITLYGGGGGGGGGEGAGFWGQQGDHGLQGGFGDISNVSGIDISTQPTITITIGGGGGGGSAGDWPYIDGEGGGTGGATILDVSGVDYTAKYTANPGTGGCGGGACSSEGTGGTSAYYYQGNWYANRGGGGAGGNVSTGPRWGGNGTKGIAIISWYSAY